MTSSRDAVRPMPVPLFDTSTPRAALRGELRAAIERVLDSERYILGPEVEEFEREFAGYCGAAHGVGVANGTEAITIALRAMGVGPGDEVVVPSFSFYASAEAIPPTGACPVFCRVWTTSSGSARARSGCRRSTPLRTRTSAMTSPATPRSIPTTARSRTSTASSPLHTRAGCV